MFILGAIPTAGASYSQEKEYITNIALGKYSTANCYESSDKSPSAGNDGLTSTLWVADNGASGNWWMVDLGDVYDILGNEVVFEYEGDVWQYIVETSLDGDTWTTAADKTQNTSDIAVQSDLYNTAGLSLPNDRTARILYQGELRR